ncbi:thiamine phosphate synthase [Desertivirga xinjiangensis]|uniref:thiamine phosphate synthase n=1 Tax=Desertivirga xinjiangensis TaxID=539206 RepID=UPI00210DEB6D|nr:thiamine phosphate synthase [Pedobacter xinjiangensis]
MIDRLHFISQKTTTNDHLDGIENALISGCKWIQLRVKNESDSTVLSYAYEAKKVCDKYRAKLIINDYPHIGKEVSAYGIHLGLSDMSIEEAKKIAGNKLIIGGTANTLEDILGRVKSGADYVGLGPFRYTPTKEKLSPVLGFEGYTSIVNNLKILNIKIPLIAIGGITLQDVSQLRGLGVHGVAVSAAITFADDQKTTIEEFYTALERTEMINN